jgi:hypothetical protein
MGKIHASQLEIAGFTELTEFIYLKGHFEKLWSLKAQK